MAAKVVCALLIVLLFIVGLTLDEDRGRERDQRIEEISRTTPTEEGESYSQGPWLITRSFFGSKAEASQPPFRVTLTERKKKIGPIEEEGGEEGMVWLEVLVEYKTDSFGPLLGLRQDFEVEVYSDLSVSLIQADWELDWASCGITHSDVKPNLWGRNFQKYVSDLPPELRHYLTDEVMAELQTKADRSPLPSSIKPGSPPCR